MGEKICISDGNVYVSMESTGREILLVDMDSVFLPVKGQNKKRFHDIDIKTLSGIVWRTMKRRYPESNWTVSGYRKA